MIIAKVNGKPKIELVISDSTGNVCASLYNWDIAETEDSYSITEVNELIVALENAKSAMTNAQDNNKDQMEFKYGDNK